MLVSVIVVTFRRLHLLQRCLKSVQAASLLAREAGIELECRVAINGDDPETQAWLERARLPELAIRAETILPAVSPAAARNRALRSLNEASGQWVLFLDDDVEIPAGYFVLFAGCLGKSAHPSTAAIGGPNLTARDSTLLQRAIGIALASRFATFLSVSRYRPTGEPRECGEEALMLCNLFVRRDVLGTEPFPEEFVCAEENWLIQELGRRGYRSRYEPRLSVHHERRPSLHALAKQVFRYGIGRAQHIRRKPSSLRFAHVFPSLCLVYALATPALGLPLLPFIAYPPLALVAGLRAGGKLKESVPASLAAAFLFPVIHCSYGAGVLRGLLFPPASPGRSG